MSLLEFAYYPGCAAKQIQKEADWAARAVCKELGITLHPMPRATCCGAVSLRESKPAFSLAVAARILSEAESQALSLVTICNTCLQTLSYANHRFKTEPDMLEAVNNVLKQAGVRTYQASVKIFHLLWVIIDQIDPNTLRGKVKRPLQGLKVAPFYGCHSLRPATIFDGKSGDQADHLDRLISLLGGTPVSFEGWNRCCGFHVMLSDPVEMRSMVADNCLNARHSGAQLMISPCPLCDMALNAYQGVTERTFEQEINIPEVNFAQLLGISLGIDEKILGIDRLHVSPKHVLAAHGVMGTR